MGEIGKIVRTVMAEDLPDDIRRHFKAGSVVTTVYEGMIDEPRRSAPNRPRLSEEEKAARVRYIMSFMGVGRDLGTTTEEAVSRIRALRDEWD